MRGGGEGMPFRGAEGRSRGAEERSQPRGAWRADGVAGVGRSEGPLNRRGPVGRDELAAQARVPGRPIRPPGAQRPPARRPVLPEDRPRLQREAYRDLRQSVPSSAFDDVVKAFGAAGEALAEGDPERAVPLLEWAKTMAPRASVVREALGIAYYQLGDFNAAASELSAYRRMSGREDQNHLLADSVRAAGRHDRVREYVEAMTSAPGVGQDRIVEGALVLSGDLADQGELAEALAVLQRADLTPTRIEPWQPRLWYAAADLSERLDDEDAARDYLEAILAVDPLFLDAADRLAMLDPEVTPGAGPGDA